MGALTDSLCRFQRNPVQGDFHHISEVIDQGMPVVMFDRVTNEICDKVIIDEQAAYEAVQSLIDKGRKNALVTTVDYVSVGKLRTDGYQSVIGQRHPFQRKPNH
jgi:LacI family transcriptional regulator